MVMARNALHNRRCSFGLDTSVLMDEALRLGKRSDYKWSFNLAKGSITLCKANKKIYRAGTIPLFLNWPIKDQNLQLGS